LESLTRLKEPLNLYGLVRKGEGLAYVLDIGTKHDYLPVIGQIKSDCLMPDGYDLFGFLKDNDSVFYYKENGQWIMIEKIVMDLDDAYKRTPFPASLMEKLKEAVIVIFGLGSGGSRLAVGLTRDGVSQFRLVDPDTFAIENVSRHECDLLDIGRDKVEAVKERILMVDPLAKIETFPFDIFGENEAIKEKVFDKANLVIASTDRTKVQLKINSECWKRKIPALFTGCYDEARAGEVFYVIPGETAVCYECLRGGTKQQEKPRQYDYSQARDSEKYKGEPGLNAAINFISDVAEQYAVALLLRKENCEMARLIDPKRNLLFIGGALGKGFYYLKDSCCFGRPFDFVFPVLKGPWKDCGTCQVK